MENLIDVISLKKTYEPEKKNPIFAVDDVTFSIKKGEVLGLVGESGCGKSTLGKVLLNLEPATEGKVFFHGEEITSYRFKEMRPIRRKMQMVFQNSMDSFNPYLPVEQIVMEPLKNYSKLPAKEREAQVLQMLEKVGLSAEYSGRYGSELSGGQRQRVGIARALILDPEFVVCDEAVSALDYAVRNKILRLLYDLQQEHERTYLFISHDLSAVRQICDRVIVMYMGQIMEILPDLRIEKICHPYTKALLGAALGTDPRDRRKIRLLFRDIEGTQLPETGCPFAARCLYAKEICREIRPELSPINGQEHCAACHCIDTFNNHI